MQQQSLKSYLMACRTAFKEGAGIAEKSALWMRRLIIIVVQSPAMRGIAVKREKVPSDSILRPVLSKTSS